MPEKLRPKCPSCRKTFLTDVKHAGKAVECPLCGQEMTIPLEEVKPEWHKDRRHLRSKAREREVASRQWSPWLAGSIGAGVGLAGGFAAALMLVDDDQSPSPPTGYISPARFQEIVDEREAIQERFDRLLATHESKESVQKAAKLETQLAEANAALGKLIREAPPEAIHGDMRSVERFFSSSGHWPRLWAAEKNGSRVYAHAAGVRATFYTASSGIECGKFTWRTGDKATANITTVVYLSLPSLAGEEEPFYSENSTRIDAWLADPQPILVLHGGVLHAEVSGNDVQLTVYEY